MGWIYWVNIEPSTLRFQCYDTCTFSTDTLTPNEASASPVNLWPTPWTPRNPTPGAQHVQVQAGGLAFMCSGFTSGSAFCKMLDTCGCVTISTTYCSPTWRGVISCQPFGFLHPSSPWAVVTQIITISGFPTQLHYKAVRLLIVCLCCFVMPSLPESSD